MTNEITNPLITKKPFRFPVINITPQQPTSNNKIFRIKFETTKEMWLNFIDDDVEFAGLLFMSDCGWEMRNPKVSVARLLAGTIYRISMEVTGEVWAAFALATVKEETLAKSYIVMSVDGEGLEDFDDSDMPNEIKDSIVEKRNIIKKDKANRTSKPVPKTFSEKTPAQQIAIMCSKDNFRLFIINNLNPIKIGETESMLKYFLFIKNKSEVNASKELQDSWVNLLHWFQRWNKNK